MTESLAKTDQHPSEAPEYDHHHEQESPISQRWKWMTVLGNAAIGAVELVTGNFSTMSVASDGLHNVGDSATYYMQAENILNPNLTEQRRTRLRKLAHWAIAATSLGVSVKAGIDLSLDHENTADPMTVYAASASLALNGLMLARLRRGIRRKNNTHTSVHESDLTKHFLAVDVPSAGLAVAGAVLQKYNVDIEQVAAITSGAVGAYAFRPTKANLTHNCLDHDHMPADTEHAHEHHHDHAAPKRKSWLSRMAYKPRHSHERRGALRLRLAAGVGAAALALAGGLLSGDTHDSHEVRAIPGVVAEPSIPATQPEVTVEPPSSRVAPATTECVMIKAGDSQWKIVERRVQETMGKRPSVATTNAITVFTMMKNQDTTPNPDRIQPDDCLYVPTYDAVRVLYDALEQPDDSNRALAADLGVFNSQANLQRAMNQKDEFVQVNSYLQTSLA
jgi:hypothetical protein